MCLPRPRVLIIELQSRCPLLFAFRVCLFRSFSSHSLSLSHSLAVHLHSPGTRTIFLLFKVRCHRLYPVPLAFRLLRPLSAFFKRRQKKSGLGDNNRQNLITDKRTRNRASRLHKKKHAQRTHTQQHLVQKKPPQDGRFNASQAREEKKTPPVPFTTGERGVWRGG